MSIQNRARHRVVDSIEHQPFFLPGKNPVFVPGILEGGFVYLKGAVLGRRASDGVLRICKAANGDGSEVATHVLQEVVLAFDKDGTTARDTSCAVIAEAFLDFTALVLDTSLNIQTVREQLRQVGIQTRHAGFSG